MNEMFLSINESVTKKSTNKKAHEDVLKVQRPKEKFLVDICRYIKVSENYFMLFTYI